MIEEIQAIEFIISKGEIVSEKICDFICENLWIKARRELIVEN